tara:strand:+ start:671 stop:1120 length:450 start_codon:yes stop_codon:yes gene_type:complete
MNLEVSDHLKLLGKNIEDLKVISAYCQDSLVKVKDIIFLKKNKTFIMMISRFMWEDLEKGAFRKNKRIRSAIKFEDILKVSSKKINQKNKNRLLECLAIKCNQLPNQNSEINIFFAGDGIITLISETIEVSLNDLGKPWNVKHFPKHKI